MGPMTAVHRRPSLLLLACLGCTLLLGSTCHGGDVPGDVDSLPGWLGAKYEMKQKPTKPAESTIDRRRIIKLSPERPRAYLYKGFLSDKECDHIIQTAEPRLERSTVVANLETSAEVSEIRTSSGMFIDKAADPVIKSIEQRLSEWTFLPIPNQEAMQVLKYTRGQKYVPHVDYFSDDNEKQLGGQRYATVLMYLSNVTKGGETVFSNVPDPTPKDDTWSDCAKGFLAVKPQKGDALLFFSMHPDGTPDENSMHYACPVIEGVKWSAPKWIHVRSFDTSMSDPSICADTNAMCESWARAGECEKNSKYMVGYGGYTGACRKACGSCEPWK